MATITPEAIAAYIVILGAGIGVYVKLNTEIQSLKDRQASLKEQLIELKAAQKENGSWVEGKIDLFMEKFELMNTKINEFIHEFSKR